MVPPPDFPNAAGCPAPQRTALDESAVPAPLRQRLANLSAALRAKWFGVGNKIKGASFDCPTLIVCENEQIISNGNSYIVFGQDRKDLPGSGCGGKGLSHCASLDLVVGRKGFLAKSHDDTGELNFCNPDFTTDAARIYISQMSDPDDYFCPGSGKLAKGSVSETSTNSPRSVVGIKADVLRLVARENIKIITRSDARNAQGGCADAQDVSRFGINLIAMNDDTDLQPMVKGYNLIDCLKAMVTTINNLKTMVESLQRYNRQFQQAVMQHTHTELAQPGKNTSIAFAQMPDMLENTLNSVLDIEIPTMLDMMEQNNDLVSDWLDDGGGCPNEERYILSKYNFAN